MITASGEQRDRDRERGREEGESRGRRGAAQDGNGGGGRSYTRKKKALKPERTEMLGETKRKRITDSQLARRGWLV